MDKGDLDRLTTTITITNINQIPTLLFNKIHSMKKIFILLFLALSVFFLTACSMNDDKITHEPNEIRVTGLGTFNLTNVTLITYSNADSVPQYYGLYFSDRPYDQGDKSAISVEICLDKVLMAADHLNEGHYYYPTNPSERRLLSANYVYQEGGVRREKTTLTEGVFSVINMSSSYLFDFKLIIDGATIESSCDLGVSNKQTIIN